MDAHEYGVRPEHPTDPQRQRVHVCRISRQADPRRPRFNELSDANRPALTAYTPPRFVSSVDGRARCTGVTVNLVRA